MPTDDGYHWITNHGDGGFGAVRESDDLLHVTGNPQGASVTETYYFGFHVTGEALHGFIYIWCHPNLGVVTAGVMISRGFQRSALVADFVDFRTYMKIDDQIDRSSGAMKFPMGLRCTLLEPMRRWLIQLDSPSAATSFDLEFTAAQAPAIRSDLKHFDQNMHVRGDMLLRGHRHRVDCYQVRDRSWCNARPEDPMPVPPYDWLTLTRGADFSMNLSLFDDLSILGNPGGALRIPPKLLQDGWIQSNGVLRRVVDVSKRTMRTASLMPMRHEAVVIDDHGQRYELVGESIGGCTWNGWHNMLWQQNLMRWTCNDQECWGESQEVQWYDTVRLLSR